MSLIFSSIVSSYYLYISFSLKFFNNAYGYAVRAIISINYSFTFCSIFVQESAVVPGPQIEGAVVSPSKQHYPRPTMVKPQYHPVRQQAVPYPVYPMVSQAPPATGEFSLSNPWPNAYKVGALPHKLTSLAIFFQWL